MANDELMRLAERVDMLMTVRKWAPVRKEIATDLRALAQRAPQHGAVPGKKRPEDFDDYAPPEHGNAAEYWSDGWNACRAAMLAAPAPEAVMINGLTEAERAKGEAVEAPYAGEFTNGECAAKLQAFLDIMKEHDPALWPRGIVREVERAVWVLRNPPKPAPVCNCRGAQPRQDMRDRGHGGYTHPAPPPAGQPEGVEATPHAIRAFKACIRDLKNMIEDASDYGLDEGHVGALETAVESIELRLASAQQANTHNKQNQP